VTSTTVSRRYARALLSLGEENGRFEAYAEELTRLEKAFEGSAELQDLWLNPAHDRAARMQAVDQLAGPLALSNEVSNVLRLLVERQRLHNLASIAQAYRDLVDQKVGRVRAVITTAVPMSAEITNQLASAIAAATKKQITLESRVDPKLIGGVVTQVGSTVLDGSLKTQLEELRTTLRQTRA
jgi:F-type H+-transporting ATPase subunit delta